MNRMRRAFTRAGLIVTSKRNLNKKTQLAMLKASYRRICERAAILGWIPEDYDLGLED